MFKNKKEKLSYHEILDDLDLTEETIFSLEQAINNKDSESKNLSDSENFSEEDINPPPQEIIQKLRESGLSSVEIKQLATSSENLKTILEDIGGINNLIKISPAYRLNVVKKELSNLKNKSHLLQKANEEVGNLKKIVSRLELEINSKKQELDNKNQVIENQNYTIENLNIQLSNANAGNKQLQETLKSFESKRDVMSQSYSQRIRESYKSTVEGDYELFEVKKNNNKLLRKLQKGEEEYSELKDDFLRLKEETLGLVDKKQKEWDKCYSQLNEQRRIELLTIQGKKEQEVLKYQQQVKKLTGELERLKFSKNPILGVFNKRITKLKETGNESSSSINYPLDFDNL